MLKNIYEFSEHGLTIKGDKQDLINIVEALRQCEYECEGTFGDLVYKIEYAFDIDGIRSSDEGKFDTEFENYYLSHLESV